MQAPSCLSSGNAAFVEGLYESFLEDRDSVSAEWQEYFDQLQSEAHRAEPDISHAPVRQRMRDYARASAAGVVVSVSETREADSSK